MVRAELGLGLGLLLGLRLWLGLQCLGFFALILGSNALGYSRWAIMLLNGAISL